MAPQIAGKNTGIVNPIRNRGRCVKVVAGRVIPVEYRVHTVFVDQAFKRILHESDNDRDAPDPCAAQLPDQVIDNRSPLTSGKAPAMA